MRIPFPRFLLLLSALLSVAGCSTPAKVAPDTPPGLQLQVNLPPVWHPLVEDDVSEMLASLVQVEFRRAGFQERIALLKSTDDVAEGVPLLIINVAEWRISRTGAAECLFNARLRTAGGENVAFGMVTYSDFTTMRGDSGFNRPYALTDALEDAAVGAIRDLRRRVADSGKLAGFTKR